MSDIVYPSVLKLGIMFHLEYHSENLRVTDHSVHSENDLFWAHTLVISL